MSRTPWFLQSPLPGNRPGSVATRFFRSWAVTLGLSVGLGLLTGPALHAQSQPGDLVRSLRIGDQSGGFLGHLTNANGFGSAVARIGDIDGNGIADLAVGAPADDGGGHHRGAVWILFRGTDGHVLRSQKIGSKAGKFTGTLDNEDAFGHAVAAIGDLDGDGIPDLAVGAPGDDDGGSVIFPDPSVGAVWILYLRRDGQVREHRKISATAGDLTGPLNELDRFGSSIASMGDFDGDGVVDLAVGAPGDNDFGINAGAFWLLHLDTDGAVVAEVKNPLGSSSTAIGSTLANIGDLNGDGTPDVATAGSVPDFATGKPIGYVVIAFMDTDGTALSATTLQAPAGATDDFGSSVSSIPDIDGDGFAELVIGAHRFDGGGPQRGAVWIAYMLPAGFVKSYSRIDSDNSMFTPALANGDGLGFSIAGLGDDDGDGIPDLLVGAPGDNGLGEDRGAIWRLSLTDGKWNSVSPGLGGSAGIPSLKGTGLLVPGTPVTLSLENAAPGRPVWVVLGSDRLDQPFLGGVLVPRPDVIMGPHIVRADSTLRLTARWPSDIAPATTVYYQAWIRDAGAPEGYASSNGLASTTR